MLDLAVTGFARPDDVDVGLQQAAALGQHHPFERHAPHADDGPLAMTEDRGLMRIILAGERADIGVERHGQPVKRGE
ncbi:hypothetical protein D3C81_1337200 [compost metagenome]